MVESLHAGLESRAVIEQAKGVLHAELGVSPAEAFRLLSRYSQNTNQRVRKISAGLVQGRIAAAEFRPPVQGEPQLPGGVSPPRRTDRHDATAAGQYGAHAAPGTAPA
jgi:hypothetical protein